MSDEEESMSEGFSASEDEWKPSKEAKGGESSDDDDSDFEESPVAALTGVEVGSGAGPGKKKSGEPKARSAAKQTASKKRPGLSLRAKLYNKYRPLPKTFSPPSSVGKNSPSASTSRTNPKNAKAPSESSGKHQYDDDEGSTSDGSIDNYLVNPEELDFQSSFFNVDTKTVTGKSSVSPAPEFDCNAGLGKLSDSETEDGDNNDSGNFHREDTKAFDFRDLLENANSLERAKETIAKRSAVDAANKKIGTPSKSLESKVDTMDVYSLLALGEKQNHRSHNEGEDEEDDEEDDEEAAAVAADKDRGRSKGPSKLSKTKSTRVKRHTKTRPASTVVAGGDTDDSDFEEVADTSEYADTTQTTDISHQGNLEIFVELPSRQRDKKTKTQQDIENALKRKLNREMKDRQLLMHKASLLCHFGRTYVYNRLLNDTILMQKALKLLPSNNSYPPERGTEIKYYQSLVTWFKSAITLASQNLYPENKVGKKKIVAHKQLQTQIEKRKARSKQDMVFIFVILLRGMGLQCRLIVNMQPLPLKPAQSDLLSIKMKQGEDDPSKDNSIKKAIKKVGDSINITDDEPQTSSNAKLVNQKIQELNIEIIKNENLSLPNIKRHDKWHEDLKATLPKNAKGVTSKTSISLDKIKQNKCKILEEQPSLRRISKKSQGNKKDGVDHPTSSIRDKIPSQCAVENVKAISPTIETQKNKSTRDIKSVKENPKSCTKSVRLHKIETETNSEAPMADKYVGETELLAKSIKLYANHSTTEMNNKKSRKAKTINIAKSCTASDNEIQSQEEQVQYKENKVKLEDNRFSNPKRFDNSQKENATGPTKKPTLARLKRTKVMDDTEAQSVKKSLIESGSSIIPTIVVKGGKEIFTAFTDEDATTTTRTRDTRSRSKSPKVHISSAFLQSKKYKEKFPSIMPKSTNVKKHTARGQSPSDKVQISVNFLQNPQSTKRVLRSRQKTNEGDPIELNSDTNHNSEHLQIPQTDGADDEMPKSSKTAQRKKKQKQVKREKRAGDSDEEFEPSPTKRPKPAPTLAKKDRRVLSTDDEENKLGSPEHGTRKPTAGDMWVEVWSDVEEQWVCVDLSKGKIHCVDTIRKSASSNLSYVFAFQNDLSVKDVTARYCPNWTTVVRKTRIDKAWLDTAIQKYQGLRTMRDLKEDQDLRRIHEQKPMPTVIGDYKNHPFYALERHLLKFEAIYPPDAPTLGYIRKEAVYSRDCIHTLRSRDIWLKEARVVKLGEKPYKIVKARPKWDRITQTVIKDQPLEVFGYWQTQDYDPPTAENGMVPRNAYGNVELFKPTMLPKKCVHIRLPGLNRICKKLGVDCANAVVGFDFHQGACHPTYDGFIVCEEFLDQVTAAWYQDQEEQERKEQEKYEARVYGNWKKLIRGLRIRERLKLKYNF